MEKTHLEINVNGKTQDCVVSHFMEAQKDKNGKVIWTQPDDCIAKVKGSVAEITVYVKDDYKVSVVKLSAFAVKALYAHIMEIEAKEGEQFVDV